ncbi:MAG: glycosyltransferase [Nanoarchaeota archaeon]|nr:glycosyltransferase [Nanoarchaeota archaeon]
MDISIVVPVLNEQRNVSILTRVIDQVMKKNKFSYEIIFIDDGSTDKTYLELKRIHSKNKNVKVIKFRKNFSKTPAYVAAFERVKGDIIISMDGDLQNDPRDIPRFVAKIREGYDLVGGWRIRRKDLFISKKLPSKIYNWMSKKITKVQLHDSDCGFRAMKNYALQNIKLYGEMHRYIPMLFLAKGYKLGEIPVRHHKRKYGKTKYGLKRIVKGTFDLLFLKFWIDYSTRPLHIFGILGIFCFVLGFLIFLYNIIKYGIFLSMGPTLIFSGIVLLMGIQFIVLGILGEMLTRTYYERTNEKFYEIEEILK